MENFYKKNITEKFDDELKENGFYYLPWIGKNYPNSNFKTLIVGESYYNWGKNDKEIEKVKEKTSKNDFIRVLVKYHGFFHTLTDNEKGGGKKGKLFINLEKAILNKEKISPEEIEKFWENIAFYEFVENPLSNIKERPSKKDYEHGAKNIQKLIDVIDPQLIILLGTSYDKIYSLQKLYKGKFFNNEKKIDSFNAKRIDFNYNGKPKRIIAIGHPSSSYRKFNWKNWTNYIKINMQIENK